MSQAVKNQSSYNVRNSLVNYYLLIMFTFFPIFLSNHYAHARTDKFFLYLILSGILIISTLCVSLAYINDKNSSSNTAGASSSFKLSAPDICFLLFFVFAAISTLTSSHKLDSLSGNAGRNNGLILLLVYLLIYFILSRFYYYKEYVIIGYIVGSSLVAFLSDLHFFYIDPFGLLDGYSADIVEDFASTIGNKNTIAAFMCLFLPVAIALFVISKKRYLKVTAGFGIFFAYTGLLTANSNSAFIGLAAVLCAMLIIFTRKFEYLRAYFLALFIMFSSAKILRLFSLMLHDNSKAFESIQQHLVYGKYAYIPIILCLAIYLILTLFKGKIECHYKAKPLKIIFISLTALLFSALLFAFIYFSVFDLKTDLGSFETLFRFNAKWGTHRGFMWIYGLKEYWNFDVVHKLLGSGPDTFYYVFEPYFQGLSDFGDTSTDCIHNEYLNYLVTQGILGLLSYVSLLVAVLARSIKNSRNNPIIFLFMFSVISYAAQSVVNLYQPITTPIFFIFISLCEGLNRSNTNYVLASNINATNKKKKCRINTAQK